MQNHPGIIRDDFDPETKLKVVNAVPDPNFRPSAMQRELHGDTYPILLELSRPASPEESKLIGERLQDGYAHGSCITLRSTVEQLRDRKDQIQAILTEVETEVRHQVAKRKEANLAAQERHEQEQARQSDELKQIDW